MTENFKKACMDAVINGNYVNLYSNIYKELKQLAEDELQKIKNEYEVVEYENFQPIVHIHYNVFSSYRTAVSMRMDRLKLMEYQKNGKKDFEKDEFREEAERQINEEFTEVTQEDGIRYGTIRYTYRINPKDTDLNRLISIISNLHHYGNMTFFGFCN